MMIRFAYSGVLLLAMAAPAFAAPVVAHVEARLERVLPRDRRMN